MLSYMEGKKRHVSESGVVGHMTISALGKWGEENQKASITS